MSTLLLVWYASGWAGLAGLAIYVGEVTWGSLLLALALGPNALFASIVCLSFEHYGISYVIWQKRL